MTELRIIAGDHVAEVPVSPVRMIRQLRRDQVALHEVDQRVLAKFPAMTIQDMAEAYREAARLDEQEADALQRYLEHRRAGSPDDAA